MSGCMLAVVSMTKTTSSFRSRTVGAPTVFSVPVRALPTKMATS